MDLYTLKPQQQSTQQIDTGSMATSSPAISSNTILTATSTSQTTTTSTTSATGSTSANITYNSNNKNNTNGNIKDGGISLISTVATITAADADTVAIAKDMLQLHQGATTINNNNNSTNISSSYGNGTTVAATETIDKTTDTMNSTDRITLNAPGSNIDGISNHQAVIVERSNSPLSSGSISICNNSNLNVAPSFNAADKALGYLKYEGDILYISGQCTVIGRNSSTSIVQFHIGENNLVSRKHFQLLYDADSRDFYVHCLSKNGIFVDDFLQRRNADPLKLPPSCHFRFPSTDIRIQFENFMQSKTHIVVSNNNEDTSYPLNNNHNQNHGAMHNNSNVCNISQTGNENNAHVIISPAPPEDHPLLQSSHHSQHFQSSSSSSALITPQMIPMDSSNIYSPLKISIPKKEQKSPYLSPTGTISAANSCPASPRQGIYQNQINYNNYANSNLQNDNFQTPSTVNYNINEKPPYSYAQLIVQAISAAPDKQLTLSGIYSFIVKHYPYYRKETNKGWQNSIRHNLSLNRYFIKVARSQDEPGKGSFWRIDPESGAKLIDHSYKKRRQRSSQGFRPSYGMPRSAPVSPTHMDYTADNSRESSPLQDIVLQSAPGSPGISIENRAVENDLMYNSQSMHQSGVNNAHVQYNSGSPLFISNTNSSTGGGGQQQSTEAGDGGGGTCSETHNSLKRNHSMSTVGGLSHFAQQQQQSLHPEIIYDEMPTDYSGNMDSGDECDPPKRPKYISETI